MNLNISTPYTAFKGKISEVSQIDTSKINNNYKSSKDFRKMTQEERQLHQLEVMDAIYTQLEKNTQATNKLAESMEKCSEQIKRSMDIFSDGVEKFRNCVNYSKLSRF